MSDVSEQAKELAKVLYPGGIVDAGLRHVQRAIDAGWVQRDTLIAELEAQGWTPPPDPPLTDAERVAKAWLEAEGRNWEGAQWPEPIRKAQVLIDSGLITVVSPPDPWDAMTLLINPTPWPLAAEKIEGHWVQGAMYTGDRMCLVGGLQSCGLAPGEWLIARAVARHRDHGERWNDAEGRTEAEVVGWLRSAEPITPEELAEVFGPQWEPVCALVLRAARLTPDEAKDLEAARAAAWDAANAAWDAWDADNAAWDAANAAWDAWDAANAARDADNAAWDADNAAWDADNAAWDAANAARDAARAARDAARAAGALVVRDLIGQHGFTQAHYDLLTGPWRTVIGPVHPDDGPLPDGWEQGRD